MDLALLIIATWILSTCFHEFGHAITAYWGGDKSVKDKGYLTLNPFVYINSATTLVIPVLALMLGGIALPGAAVSINTSRIKSRAMLSFISFAGPLFTFIFLIGLVIFLHVLPLLKDLIGNAHIFQVFTRATCTLIYLHIFVFILNLLPLPPLDGFGIIEPWLPAPIQRKAREFGNLGFLFIMAMFFFFPPFSDLIQFASALGAMVLGAPGQLIDSGFRAIKQNSYFLVGLLVIAFIAKSKLSTDDEKAQKLVKERKFEEALPLFQSAVEKKPDDPRLVLGLSTCLLSLGRREEALKQAEKAISLDAESAQAYGVAAACLSDMDQPEKALEMSERAIKYDTSNFYPFTHIVKATALNSLGRYEEALEAAEVYLKREKNPGEALIVKADALENMGRLDEALAVYDKAARSTGANSLHLQLSKGLLLCAAGKTAEGLSEFEKFLPKAPAAKDTRIVEVGKLQALMLEKSHQYAARGDAQKSENLRRAAEDLN